MLFHSSALLPFGDTERHTYLFYYKGLNKQTLFFGITVITLSTRTFSLFFCTSRISKIILVKGPSIKNTFSLFN